MKKPGRSTKELQTELAELQCGRRELWRLVFLFLVFSLIWSDPVFF